MELILAANPDELRKKFYSLSSRQDIADLLEIDINTLIYYVYRLLESSNYTVFQIPKRKGGFREIMAPVTPIKILQKKLNQVLQCVYKTRPPVHSYVGRRSVTTNAKVHTASSYVLNIDLKDFFPSLHFGRIKGLFMSAPFNFNRTVAITLAKMCCFNKILPQGAPTSPILSNMICATLDRHLSKLARDHDCRYTRYADDITFSTDGDFFHESIAYYTDTGKLELGTMIKEIIDRNTFSINQDKIKVRNAKERQEVTGVIVNEFANLPRRYFRKIRAMLHAWEKYGLDAAEKEFLARYNTKHRLDTKYPLSFAKVVKGKIDYLGAVRGKNDPTYLKFRQKLRQLAPYLLTNPETPMEFVIRTSNMAHVTSIVKSVQTVTDRSQKLRLFLTDLGLESLRQGAWSTFYGDSSDKLRQAAHSMRELLRIMLKKLAPDDQVTATPWYNALPPSETQITRKMRVRYILSGNSMNVSESKLSFINSIVKFVDESYSMLCRDAHSEDELNIDQTKIYLDSCEIIILMILINKC